MARIDFGGRLVDEAEIRAAHIGCGSHSFRNILPTYQFAPVDLAATCDLDLERARAFAATFGAQQAYGSHQEMLAAEKPEAVFLVIGYDGHGRPAYPGVALDCIEAGCHVWMEKPPAATCAELAALRDGAERRAVNVMVGLKKMFFPANEKAKSLMATEDFGAPALATFQYPQYVPTMDEFEVYLGQRVDVPRVRSFLDHLCHPMSLILYLLGMPESLFYQRSPSGAGSATFSFASGAIATLALTHGAARNGGMERTTIVGTSGHHIVVDNCQRVSYHQDPPTEPGSGYGRSPDFFQGDTTETTAVWEPEFSLGQLYNKGVFLLGYYNEVNEFARSILDHRQPRKGTLTDAWRVTKVFEAFAHGPGKVISLA